MLFIQCLVGLLVSVIAYFLIFKLRFVIIVFKTLPRDFRLITRIVKLQLRLRWLLWQNATIGSIFESIVKKHPDKPCFYFGDEVWTCSMVDRLANQFANYFQLNGYRKGDHVALFMENRVEYVCVWLGLSKIGVVTALINTNLRHGSLCHCLELSKSKAIIYGYELSDAVEEVSGEPCLQNMKLLCFGAGGNPIPNNRLDLDLELPKIPATRPRSTDPIGMNDTVLYIYTSGTTGLPKAAIIRHSRVMVIGYGGKVVNGIRDTDIVYVPMALYHNFGGVMGMGQAFLSGIPVVLTKKFSASMFWKDCIRYNVTVSQYMGETCRFLMNQPPSPEDRTHKVRMMFGIGLRPEIWPEFIKRFNNPRIAETYGATEGNAFLVNIDGHVGAVGYMPVWARYVMPQTLVLIDDLTGNPIRDPKTGFLIEANVNEPGEMISPIRLNDPIQRFEGYTDSESNQKKILRDVFKKGDSYFRSGDILSFDDHGYYYFRDRSGDTFRWKGENVSTTEVEGVFGKLTEFRAAVVYGVKIPNTEGKAGMIAIVDPENTLNLAALSQGIRRELPSYARPIFLRTVSLICTTGTFKLQKGDLQKEGFNVHEVQAGSVYCLINGDYVPLDNSLYEKIMAGQMRL